MSSSIYSKKYTVEVRDVDFNKDLKLSSLFSYFQEISGLGADALGIGIETLHEQYQVAWVLVKMKVEIMRSIKLNETIEIETWPQKPKPLEFERDFIVKDQVGDVIARARSLWVIIDVNTRSLKRSRHIEIEYPPIREERAIDKPFERLNNEGDLLIAYKKVVGYSDIDINGHLNNAKYIDFIMDCFSVENHNLYRVENIQVNFSQEVLAGESIILYKDTSQFDQHLIYIEGVHEESQKTVFKVKVNIKQK